MRLMRLGDPDAERPVVRIDDFAIRTLSTRVFTPDILKRLRIYSSAGISSIAVTPGDIAAATTDTYTAADLTDADL